MSLTSELDDLTSPISQWMRDCLPAARDVLAEYRLAAPDLRLPAQAANPGTTGGALDWRMRFLVDPHPDLTLPVGVAVRLGEPMAGAAATLTEMLASRVAPRPGDHVLCVDDLAAFPVREEEFLLRGCWALALLTEVYRAGLFPGSPLTALPDAPTVDDLLALAPDAALTDLQGLTSVAATTLLPALRSWGQPVYVGPVFAGSRHVPADADIIAGGVLLEVKSTVGQKRKDGTRYCALDALTLRQIIGYVLFDFDDRYAIRQVALYSARYGYLVTWPLDDLLPRLAGKPVTLAELRENFAPVVRVSGRPR